MTTLSDVITVSIPRVSDSGEILKPMGIQVQVEAKDSLNYTFKLFREGVDITELYEALLGTSPDCDQRFTSVIESHLDYRISSKNPQLNFSHPFNFKP